MLIRILKTIKNSLITKKYSELRFWQHEIQQYQKWFNGELPQLYKTRSPLSINIVLTENIKDSSILEQLRRLLEKHLVELAHVDGHGASSIFRIRISVALL